MGIKKVKGWWLIRLALTIVGKKGIGELKKASKNAIKAQEQTLRNILSASKDTVYGKEHHFDEVLAASSPQDLFERYRKEVSINDYEDLRPYVERHKQGEAGVLFPGKPKMYATTSGTTKEPKWIPITERYYQEVYKVMNQLWFYAMITNKPKVFYGKTLSIVGKATEGAAPDGTVFGSISGISQRDIPGFMKVLHPAPADIFNIADYKARYYTIMRMGIEQDCTLIITANPSTLVEMQNNANEFYDDYVEDIEKGTLSRKFPIPDEIRAVLAERLKPNPERAAELRRLKAQYGNVLPRHYWPNMQAVNVWFCGNTGIFLEKVKDSFPKTCVFHEFGYFATECRPGIVLKSNTPDTVVFGHKVYVEFVHESELESENPRVYQMYEVKKGERYCLIVTTSAGLYRYNMNDLIEITGFINQFPTLKLIQKVNGTVNITGEKLHERQFIEAVHAAERDTGNRVAFFVGFADVTKPTYRFYYEFVNHDITQEKAENFTRVLDEYLKKYNIEYESKRASNRLKQPETALLVNESFEKFKATCIDKGYRDGQFKVNLLMQDEKRHALFKELVR
ncbi:GH3 auxin-responsive promoter family protein [Leadbettera azotonutricia]|uniref:GH3 auxin-responsive promoter superfamily n=1 Tax=Leadbettera azotonutricia (strain ATCC BAA-888 / DSM 13862 / ZAS-9) TaxID=545695 RepID=F5YCK0_LEAAZ|nr:GH3 auxin-responsive promoter family protein [Leadbettera azotonutricia]AEF83277.1 GH3 auxin-responsive promoter superfamily [Leadbettera azotonutricia ZAS-9]